MTLIQDMTEPQRQAWVTLLADGAVLAWFVMKMTGGGKILDYSPEGLSGILIGVVIASIILHAVIAAIFELQKRKDEGENAIDERDRAISDRSDKYGYYALCTVLVIVLFGYLMQLQFEDDYLSPLRLTTPSHLVFILVAGAYFADLLRMVVRLWHYHR